MKKRINLLETSASILSIVPIVSMSASCGSNSNLINVKDWNNNLDRLSVESALEKLLDKNVTIEYANRDKTLPSKAKIDLVKFPQYDNTDYIVTNVLLLPNDAKGELGVLFGLQSKKYPEIVNRKYAVATGFVSSEQLEKQVVDGMKIDVSYNKAGDILGSKANVDDLLFSGYDVDKYVVTEKTIVSSNNENGTILVSYKVQSKEFPKVFSEVKSSTVSGFKTAEAYHKELVEAEKVLMNKAIAEININYRGKDKIKPTAAVTSGLIIDNYDTDNFRLSNISLKNPDSEAGSIVVEFTITSIKFPEVEKKGVEKQITNFLTNSNETKIKRADVQAKIATVNFDLQYVGKERILPSEASRSSIDFVGLSNSDYTVNRNDIKLSYDDDNGVLTVSFNIISKEFTDITSARSVKIVGFKTKAQYKKELRLAEQLAINSAVDSVIVEHPYKNAIVASGAAQGDFNISGFDSSKYFTELVIDGIDIINGVVTVRLKLFSRKYPDISSNVKTLHISGFMTYKQWLSKQINIEAQKTYIYYEKPSNLPGWVIVNGLWKSDIRVDEGESVFSKHRLHKNGFATSIFEVRNSKYVFVKEGYYNTVSAGADRSEAFIRNHFEIYSKEYPDIYVNVTRRTPGHEFYIWARYTLGSGEERWVYEYE